MHISAFFRNVRVLQILAQIIFVLLLALAAGFLYANVSTNLARQGLAVGYDFITNPASFDIGESHIPYEASDNYGRALLVGLVNTLVVSALGIVLTTIVGVIAGIARLSSNWLISRLAAAYVGVIRNTPLIIQLAFWYFGIILKLPPVRNAVALPGSIFLTQRGVYLPWYEPLPAFDSWRIYVDGNGGSRVQIQTEGRIDRTDRRIVRKDAAGLQRHDQPPSTMDRPMHGRGGRDCVRQFRP